MKKAKILITSLLTIIVCSTIVVGSTYSLFTTSDETNIAITSGKVKLTAAINSNLEVYSPKSIDPSDYSIKDETNIASNSTFGNGGTAKIETDGTLTLDKMTPGDKATFKINFSNESNINIKYRVSFTDVTSYSGSESYKLIDELVVTANESTIASDDVVVDWTDVEAGASISDVTVSVELPTTTDNDYQDLSSSLKFTVEAVQGNTYIEPIVSNFSYLTFTADVNDTHIIPKFVSGDWSYSTDGINWTEVKSTDTTNYNDTTIVLNNTGDEVKLKGTNCVTDDDHHFDITGSASASGDVTSLTNGVGGDVNLAKAYSNLGEGSGCYQSMFSKCSLTTAPSLPSTTLSDYCYKTMFKDCIALTSAPLLPASTLTKGCYMQMFNGCTNLRIVSSSDDESKKIFTCTVDCKTNGGANGNSEVTDMFKGTNLLDENATPENGITYYWLEEACFASGTKVTMADGTFKNIENITEGDSVLTFNHETGVYEAQKVYLVWVGDYKSKAFTLNFDNGNSISIVGEHDLFEKESLKYMTISKYTAEQFIGKHFYSVADQKYVELLSITYETELVDFYSLYVGYNANCIANGMLSVSVEAEDSLNIYEFYEDLTIDHVQLEKDIEKYGIFEYSENAGYSKEYYDALKIKYINIMVGKGLVTWDKIIERIEAGLE